MHKLALRFHLFPNRLFISHLRFADVRLHFELAQQAIDAGLPGLRVRSFGHAAAKRRQLSIRLDLETEQDSCITTGARRPQEIAIEGP